MSRSSRYHHSENEERTKIVEFEEQILQCPNIRRDFSILRAGITTVGDPDGCRVWIVAFAIFIINFIIVGFAKISGILFVDFMRVFHIGRKAASTPFSIQQSTRNLLGMAMAFTSNINEVIPEQYFTKHQTSASGLALSGANIGAICFPIILEKITPNYGVPITFLAMGAVMLLVVPATIILQDPLWVQKETKSQTHSNRSGQETLNNSSIAINFQSEEDSDHYRKHMIENDITVYNNQDENDIASVKASCSQANDDMIGETIYSQKNIDFNFLRQNENIIYHLLSMNILHSESPKSLPMDNLEIHRKSFIKKELEEFYSSLEKSLNNFTPFISEVKKELVEYQTKVTQNRGYLYRKKEITNLSQNDESFNYLLRQKSSPNDVVFNVSVTEYYYEIPKNLYVPIELCDLFEKDEREMLSHFEPIYWKHVSKVLQELRKLNELFSPEIETSFIDNCESFVSISAWTDSHEVNNSICEQNSSHISNTFWNHIKTAINLHTNPLFLLICLCRGVHVLSFVTLLIIVVDFGMDKGLPEEDGKYLLAAVSGGDLLGCLCLGWITDHGYINLKKYMLTTMIIQAAISFIMPLVKSKGMILGTTFFYSALQGSVFVRHPVLVSKYVKNHETSIGIACMNVFSGLLGFIAPNYIGYFRDTIGSYNGLFYSNSVMCTLVGFLWVFEPYLRRISSSLRHMDYENMDSN